jgi:hypothetical protein
MREISEAPAGGFILPKYIKTAIKRVQLGCTHII